MTDSLVSLFMVFLLPAPFGGGISAFFFYAGLTGERVAPAVRPSYIFDPCRRQGFLYGVWGRSPQRKKSWF